MSDQPIRINPDGTQDYAIDVIIKAMDEMIEKGFDVYVKWTCDKCGERCTSNIPNVYNTGGYIHEEREDGTVCGYLTYPIGINYFIVTASNR